MSQCLDYLTHGSNEGVCDFIIDDNKIAPPARIFMKKSMNL